ncbi:spore coat putative kinase YutH [Bacillus sp. DJP31]|uniref:spore coat putative kinase YutH n=1 Tax=Bacillus sp. DJP31 TaxID=3409789 RepID=UPI003BB69430
MKEHLQTLFNLKAEPNGTFRSYEKYKSRNVTYLVVPVSHLDTDEVEEMTQLGEFYLQKGDHHVASIVKNKRGEIINKADDLLFVLLKCPYETNIMVRQQSLGVELAKFHKRGKRMSFPLQHLVRIGQWKSLWEKRLDQMEQFWLMKVRNHPSETFERLFVESFPYYVGLTENAIQYLVDTEMDDQPGEIDAGTVCHHRFNPECWQFEQFIKLPTDWVYDHPSRDLVEWVRSSYWGQQRSGESYLQLVNEYETISPLSTFSWRLFYSRLQFPVHYFECIEAYYKTNDEEQKMIRQDELQQMLKRSSDFEKLLREVHFIIGYRTKRTNIPKINWLG